jgi:hypothetical protein
MRVELVLVCADKCIFIRNELVLAEEPRGRDDGTANPWWISYIPRGSNIVDLDEAFIGL